MQQEKPEELTEAQQQPQYTEDEIKQIQHLAHLRDVYLQDYTRVADHVAKQPTFDSEGDMVRDDEGNKVYEEKPVMTGIFPQLRLRKVWKSDNKYNANGSLKDAEAELKRQEYLAGIS